MSVESPALSKPDRPAPVSREPSFTPFAGGIDRDGERIADRIHNWLSFFRARADKVIAIGRVMLGFAGLYLTWLDASHPPHSPTAVYAITYLYLAYAIVSAVVSWRSFAFSTRGFLIRHVIDISVWAVLMAMTDGTDSPFFMFVPFVLLTGTLYWRWRGALATWIACGAIFSGLSYLDRVTITDLDTTQTTDVSRMTFMLVSTALLVWLGARDEVVRNALLRMVEAPSDATDSREWPTAAALDYAARVMQVPRAVLVWTEPEEPWTYVADWKAGKMTVSRHSPRQYQPLIEEKLAKASLLLAGSKDFMPLIHFGRGHFEHWSGAESPINARLLIDFDMKAVLTSSFEMEELEARLFLLDPPSLTVDQMAISELVAGRVRSMFEQTASLRRLSEARAMEERMRIGRDLHDGVLQALAGTALQLREIRGLTNRRQDDLRERINAILHMLTHEQHDLREFIGDLEETITRPQARLSLHAYFSRLAERLRRQWSIEFSFELDPHDLFLSSGESFQLARMASEATANAARHGQATRVHIKIGLQNGIAKIVAEDNGSGFGMGRIVDHAELERLNIGPRSLRERASYIGGTLALDESGDSTRILIEVPLRGQPS